MSTADVAKSSALLSLWGSFQYHPQGLWKIHIWWIIEEVFSCKRQKEIVNGWCQVRVPAAEAVNTCHVGMDPGVTVTLQP